MRMLLVAAGLIIFGCSASRTELKTGVWRGTIELQGQQLPFNFEIAKDSSGFKAWLKNAGEKILLEDVKVTDDSVIFIMHIFDASLRARINDGKLNGVFVKHFANNYRLPFSAVWGEDFRFTPTTTPPTADFNGKYSVTFIHEKDTTAGVGIFRQKGNYAEGTFLNPEGDYRYLEGNVTGDTLLLSTFDGHHAFIFRAVRKNEQTITGDYWSGKAWHQTWTGQRNDKAVLPDVESLTYLKKGFDKLDFTFPDLDRKMISPSDDRFRNKVLILQIFGTWCPNCMDESKFLAAWYPKNKDRGIEILGLAYETKNDFDYASSRVRKMKEKYGVEYGFVIAGTNDKDMASKTLPALNQIIAFPTTIFIGKDGKVKRIYTGFSGPGTGEYYDEFVRHFNETVNELLSEKMNSSR